MEGVSLKLTLELDAHMLILIFEVLYFPYHQMLTFIVDSVKENIRCLQVLHNVCFSIKYLLYSNVE